MKFNEYHGSTILAAHDGSRDVSVNDLLKVNARFIGGGMSQNYAAIYLLEHLIQSFKPRYVAEIGSQKGALSLYLANMASATEQFLFNTFEINKSADWHNRAKEGVGHWFEKIESISDYCKSYEMNIFSSDAREILKSGTDLGPSIFICDGGNKIMEVEYVSTIAKPGDLCLVHDHPFEIKESNINWAAWSQHDFFYSFINLGTLFLCLQKNS